MPSLPKVNSYTEDFIRISEHIHENKKISLSSSDLSVRKKRKPTVKISSDGKIEEIRISQSVIKRFLYSGNERPDICPRNFYALEISQEVESVPSDSMMNGLYFEQRLLGKSADNDLIDLPRHSRTGEKRTDHIRIDDAVDRAKNVLTGTGMVIIPKSVQVPMKELWEDPEKRSNTDFPVYLTATADVISPFESKEHEIEFPMACIDTKLAKDKDECFINKLMPWVSFPWGCPEQMDHTQAIMYSHLFKMPFMYLIFDFNPKSGKPGWKPLVVKTIEGGFDDVQARSRKNELYQAIRWVIAKIQMMHEEGYPPVQCDRCKKCPLHTCAHKIKSIPI